MIMRVVLVVGLILDLSKLKFMSTVIRKKNTIAEEETELWRGYSDAYHRLGRFAMESFNSVYNSVSIYLYSIKTIPVEESETV